MQIRVERFLISNQPFYRGWWSSLAALWNSPDPSVPKHSAYLFRNRGVGHLEPRGKPLIGSVVLHVAAILLLFRVVDTRVAAMNSTEMNRVKNEEIYYYPLSKIGHPKPMPRIAPPGPGGKSGRGAQPQVAPKLGSTRFHPDLTVVSNPIHPDNNHQTVSYTHLTLPTICSV